LQCLPWWKFPLRGLWLLLHLFQLLLLSTLIVRRSAAVRGNDQGREVVNGGLFTHSARQEPKTVDELKEGNPAAPLHRRQQHSTAQHIISSGER
jgi:hypothetical protein